MNDLRKAAEMALEALKEVNKLSVGEIAVCLPAEIDDAMEALRQALAQPVDAVNISTERVDETVKREHEWVGLTDEEKYDVLESATGDGGRVYYDTLFRSYEAKLKEKNGG